MTYYACDKSAAVDVASVLGSGLHNDADQEDADSIYCSQFSTENICEDTIDEHTKPSAQLEDAVPTESVRELGIGFCATHAVKSPLVVVFEIVSGCTVLLKEVILRICL